MQVLFVIKTLNMYIFQFKNKNKMYFRLNKKKRGRLIFTQLLCNSRDLLKISSITNENLH